MKLHSTFFALSLAVQVLSLPLAVEKRGSISKVEEVADDKVKLRTKSIDDSHDDVIPTVEARNKKSAGIIDIPNDPAVKGSQEKSTKRNNGEKSIKKRNQKKGNQKRTEKKKGTNKGTTKIKINEKRSSKKKESQKSSNKKKDNQKKSIKKRSQKKAN